MGRAWGWSRSRLGSHGWLGALAAGLLLAVGGTTPAAARGGPPAYVLDHDADFDDLAALAVLAAQHLADRIELKAVTVTNDGAGLTGKAYLHTRCLLDQLGLADVPVADATYHLPRAFPDFLRTAIDGILDDAVGDCAAGHVAPPEQAGDLLARVLAADPGRVTLIATGPVTNLDRAFARLRQQRGWPAAFAVRTVYVLGGAFGDFHDTSLLPEGFDGSQAINTWVDPAAMRTVLRSLAPLQLRLVPDDTAQAVPITLGYIDRLTQAQATPAAAFVVRMMHQPVLLGGIAAGAPAFWWDPLATVSALHGVLDPVVRYRPMRVAVILDGPQSGRTVVTPAGTTTLVGVAADQARFETEFLDALNGR